MLSIKKKSKLTLLVYVVVHILAAALAFGCENRASVYAIHRNDINLVPIQMENPEDPIADDIDAVNKDPVIVDLDKPSTESRPRVGHTPPPPPPPVVKKPSIDTVPEASLFVKKAFWVVQNEARKIGTPCNFYVSRVLELSGYSDKSFLANDFDIYAQNHFSTYKNEIFNTANLESERLRLQRHIWSYPQRTPFIFQWERAKPKPGHIAIVERIGDQLVVYQASLNRHIARREQTSIDRLLNHTRSARMTVYSEFEAK